MTSPQVLVDSVSPSPHGYFNVSSSQEGGLEGTWKYCLVLSAAPRQSQPSQRFILVQHSRGCSGQHCLSCCPPAGPLLCSAGHCCSGRECSSLLCLPCTALLGDTAMPVPSLSPSALELCSLAFALGSFI